MSVLWFDQVLIPNIIWFEGCKQGWSKQGFIAAVQKYLWVGSQILASQGVWVLPRGHLGYWKLPNHKIIYSWTRKLATNFSRINCGMTFLCWKLLFPLSAEMNILMNSFFTASFFLLAMVINEAKKNFSRQMPFRMKNFLDFANLSSCFILGPWFLFHMIKS